MIYVNSAHVDILLMASSPYTSNFKIKLRICAAIYVLLQIRQEIVGVCPSKKCIFQLLLNILKQSSSTWLKIYCEKYFSSLQFVAEFLFTIFLILKVLLVLAVFFNSHLIIFVRKFIGIEAIVQRILYS